MHFITLTSQCASPIPLSPQLAHWPEADLAEESLIQSRELDSCLRQASGRAGAGVVSNFMYV